MQHTVHPKACYAQVKVCNRYDANGEAAMLYISRMPVVRGNRTRRHLSWLWPSHQENLIWIHCGEGLARSLTASVTDR